MSEASGTEPMRRGSKAKNIDDKSESLDHSSYLENGHTQFYREQEKFYQDARRLLINVPEIAVKGLAPPEFRSEAELIECQQSLVDHQKALLKRVDKPVETRFPRQDGTESHRATQFTFDYKLLLSIVMAFVMAYLAVVVTFIAIKLA